VVVVEAVVDLGIVVVVMEYLALVVEVAKVVVV
jgi:hypothetical protein